MQLRHTCNSASVMINLLLPPSSPKIHVQSIHKAWICHQCCIACGMILTHHANWCFSSWTYPHRCNFSAVFAFIRCWQGTSSPKPLPRWEIWFAAYCPDVCNVLWIISQQMCLGPGVWSRIWQVRVSHKRRNTSPANKLCLRVSCPA